MDTVYITVRRGEVVKVACMCWFAESGHSGRDSGRTECAGCLEVAAQT